MAAGDRITDEAREALYDAYLTLLGSADVGDAGDDGDPGDFLRRRGVVDPDLEARLSALRAARGSVDVPARHAGTDDRLVGSRIAGFRIDRVLGSGGMGVVYEATELALARKVALKLLRPEVAGTPAARERFEREAKAIARLRHPSVISVHSLGEVDGLRYLAMELVDGRSLDALLRDATAEGRPLPTTTVVRMGAALADALAAAHAAGIVHRDVKASNVLVAADGRVLLVDFGIARDLSSQAATLTDGFVGSPYAMAPERIGRRGEGALTDDPRGDVYGLGVVLWECLAGRPPFEASSLEALFQSILADEPPSLRSLRPDLAKDLETVVAKAMAKDPAKRYQSAGELREDLRALLEFRPIRARPSSRAELAARWFRRRPALTAALVVGAAAALVLSIALLVQRSTHERARAAQASAAIDDARALLRQELAGAEARALVERRYDALIRQRGERYLDDAEDRDLESLERDVASARRSSAERFDRALELVTAAERLGASSADVRRLRAELYRARHDAASGERDDITRRVFAELVAANDDRGDLVASLTGTASLRVAVSPPTARTWLFRLVEGGELSPPREPRTLALPYRGALRDLEPDAWAIEADASSGALRRGDLLLEIDGTPVRRLVDQLGTRGTRDLVASGGVVRGLRDGRLTTIAIDPASIDPAALRVTTRLLPALDSALLAHGGADGMHRADDLAPGRYVVVARAEDGAEARIPLVLSPGTEREITVRIPPLADYPPACVLLHAADDPLWIMRHEVTVAEWLAFVNDPATLAEIDDADGFLRVPRSRTEGVHCPRLADGTFGVPDDWTPSWPALGISYDDALAYLDWRNRRAEREGSPWRVALPTYDEWLVATGASGATRWVFGDRWRPKWTSSVFAHPKPTPAPVMSFPVDESVIGAYDLAGSVAEFVDSWWREDVGHRRHAGGSWAFGQSDRFEISAGNGMPASAPSDVTGVRLVVRRARSEP
ncbi:MAG: protein kinase [Phycisphaerae bacterium]|nr:protein kinase [Phycisphaerae bacterium]